MQEIKIYLSGGMTGFSIDEQLKWRNQIKNAITCSEYDLEKKPIFFSPPDYYSPTNIETDMSEMDKKQYEHEAMEFELFQLRKSDLVIVNFVNPKSLGTAMELMLAKEYRIPIIGLNKDGKELHPWLSECCTKICSNMRELVYHICEFYLS